MDQCRNFITKYLDPNVASRIADVGSLDVGGPIYKHLVQDNSNWSYVGFDIAPGPNVDCVVSLIDDRWDTSVITEHQQAYDVVLSGQCLEHVRKPWLWIRDVVSLAKPNALIFIIAPNTWAFHEYPIDCWRIWPDGMRALFSEAGVDEVECYFAGHDTIGIARNK